MDDKKELGDLVAKLLGSPEKIIADLKLFRKSMDYFFDNEQQLRRDRPNEYIAIYDGEVVAHDETLGYLLKKTYAQGIVRDTVYIGNTYPLKTLLLAAI